MNKYQTVTNKIKWIILGILSLTTLFGFRINTFLLGLLVFFWIIEGNYINKVKLLWERKVFVYYIALFVVYSLSMFYSDDFIKAWKYVEIKLLLLIMPVIIGSLQGESKKSINRILIGYIIGVVAAVLICYINATYQYYHNRIWTAFTIYRFPNILNIHRASFALAIAFSIVLLLIFVLKKETKLFVKILLISLIGFLLYTIVIVGARLPALALPIAINVILVIYYLQKPKLILSLVYIILVNLFVASIIYFALNNVLIDRFIEMQDDVRLEIWLNALALFKEKVIFGYGIGDAQNALMQSYSENGLNNLMDQNLNSHNQYLQIGLEAGLIGIIILLLNLFKPFVMAFRKKDYSIIAFVLLISICFLSEAYLNRFNGILFYTLLINILSLKLYLQND